MDNNLLKDLAKLRKKREKEEKEGKYSIVCEHIFMASPIERVDAIVTKKHHSKHDGKIYGCFACSTLFDNENALELLNGKLYVAEEKLFINNIKSVKDR